MNVVEEVEEEIGNAIIAIIIIQEIHFSAKSVIVHIWSKNVYGLLMVI